MRHFTFLIIAFCIVLSSCKNEGGSQDQSNPSIAVGKVASSGGTRELVVAVSPELLNDENKELIREYFSPDMYGMPQIEKQNNIFIIPSTAFSTTYQRHKNVIMIEKSDSLPSFREYENLYAAPQSVAVISAKDWNGLKEMFDKHHVQILDKFHDGDIKFLQNKFAKIAHRNTPKLLAALGVEMTVPNYFRPVMANSDFVWMLKDVKKGKHLGTVNILVYRYKDATGQMIDPISLRDTIGKHSVVGQLKGTYMSTEKAALYPLSENIEIQDMFAVETRGLWRTEGDFMGGPFINYTIYDDKTDTVYGVDGFVYFPSQDKAHYIFELEAILRTFKLVGRDAAPQ